MKVYIKNSHLEGKMLNLIHVSKTYRPKKGKEVEALRDVHLSIADKGLVFLLGKSGSGKSTLMNLIGGLDTPDQGDILFYGKNIVSLSNEDYDAYRNTTVGFIFQEFNLIESFSVYKNIILSLELQGKSAKRDEVIHLLETLDLAPEIDRMPYELSGGQKQRVSIARALIKTPKIILADEPTGSLDSDTGKQIFEVLKKLSKNQLVIVVSHDRDYAEAYGDRIIELSDGKVIKDTQPIQIETLNEPFELTKSRMPLKDAFLLGFSAFVRKPVRMVFTILLLTFAFTLFGVVDSTANYHTNDVVIQTIYDRGESALVISRTDFDVLNEREKVVPFDYPHFEALQDAYPDYYMKEVFNLYVNFNTVYNPQYLYDYYARWFSGVVEINQDFIDTMGYQLIGRLPESEHEVVIPMHIYENYQAFGYEDGGKVIINTPEDLLGRTTRNIDGYQIVGILDTEFSKERYQRVLDNETDGTVVNTLNRELWMINDGSIHTYLYVYPGFIETKLAEEDPSIITSNYTKIETYTGIQRNAIDMNNDGDEIAFDASIMKVSSLPEDVIFKEGFNQSSLSGNQIILPMDSIQTSYAESIQNDFDDLVIDRLDLMIDTFAETHFDEVSVQLEYDFGATSWQEYSDLIKSNRVMLYFSQTYDYDHFILQATAELAMSIYWEQDVYFLLGLQKSFTELKTIIGRFDVEIVGYYSGYSILINPDLSNKIIEDMSYYPYQQIIVKLSGNQHDDLKFLYSLNDQEERFEANNEISFIMLFVNDPIVFFAGILVYVALGLAIFAGLLFYNFMSVSIHHKKKEVGILRALGARRSDVFLIFLSEAFMISMIVFVASLAVSYLIVLFGDRIIIDYFGLEVSILWISYRQLITLFLMNLGVAVLSSWIPINRFAKEKPIDTIKVV